MSFYTYLWLRENGSPYYVGKGKGNRAFRRGCPPRSHIILQEFETEQDALNAEHFLISFYGRKDLGQGILHNRSDGGEIGPTGSKHTDTWKQAQRERLRGRIVSSETREKIRRALLGRKPTEEQLAKLRAAKAANPWKWTEEMRRKKDAFGYKWCLGRKASDEARRNVSLAHAGRPRPWRIGLKHSEEAKKRMSESHKGQIAWNKGIKTGFIPWNKGIKCPQIAAKLIGNKNGQGRRQIV